MTLLWTLAWADPEPALSPMQSWAWLIAVLMALLGAVAALAVRRRKGSAATASAVVRRLGSTRLTQKVTLEVVEFEGQRILLSVSDQGAQPIASCAASSGDEHASR